VLDIAVGRDLVLGPFRTSWHALFGALALAVGVALGTALAGPGVGVARAYTCALVGVVGGIVGSRIFHVADEWQRYAADPASVLAVWNGGASIIGGIVGGVLAGGYAGIRQRLHLPHLLDAGAAALPVGMAVGRIGDVINGEHWATACSGLPWCVRYTHPATFGQREYVHPAVAYELGWDLIVAAVVLTLRRANVLGGRHIFVFIGLYGAGRLALSAVRLDPAFVLGVTQAQLVSIAFVGIALAGLGQARARDEQPVSPMRS
jgi:phosphatidylglycerol:prolipoprotein diacylglycerol transferase